MTIAKIMELTAEKFETIDGKKLTVALHGQHVGYLDNDSALRLIRAIFFFGMQAGVSFALESAEQTEDAFEHHAKLSAEIVQAVFERGKEDYEQFEALQSAVCNARSEQDDDFRNMRKVLEDHVAGLLAEELSMNKENLLNEHLAERVEKHEKARRLYDLNKAIADVKKWKEENT